MNRYRDGLDGPIIRCQDRRSAAHTRVGKTSTNVTSLKATQLGTVQKSTKKALPTATAKDKGGAYKDVSREAENDIGANAAIARMQAAKGAQADVKGAMQQVKDPNRRSRTYKPSWTGTCLFMNVRCWHLADIR